MNKNSEPNPCWLKHAHQQTLQNFGSLPDDACVRVQVVAALNSVAPVTVWRWAQRGTLPSPVKRGGATGWRVGDLRQWMLKAA